MPPSSQPPFVKDERVLCFHHELLYEAKVLESKPSDPDDKKSPLQYRVHYKGWKNTWDDWVPQDRLRKFTEENKELAQNLKKEMDALRQRSAPKATTASKKKHVGSDLSSTRGSEERNSSVPVTGRGQKRGREFEIEKVSKRKFNLRSSSATPPGPGTPDGSSSQGSLFASLSPRPSTSPTAGSVAGVANGSSSDLSTPPASPAASPGGDAVTTKAPKKAAPASATASVAKKVAKRPAATKITEQPKKRKLEPATADEPEPSAKRVRGAQGTKNVPVPAKGASQKPETQSGQAETSKHNNDKKQSTKVDTPKQEETFITKPAVKIPIPDNLKMILVDDWEQVTKNHALLPLPVPHPVNEILELYEADERKNRRPGSPEYDLLVETVHGIKEYFAKCLGKILLYKLEREQYYEMRACWEGCILEWEGKGPGDIYGAEHLIRLFSSLPELIAQTNMDQQSISRLREEVIKMTLWISKHADSIFTVAYEACTHEYIEKAKGNRE